VGGVEYFCYISRNKVDQLYERLDTEALYEITELRSKETSSSADAQVNWNILHIISLFRIGGSYGRKGVIQREAKVKRSYMAKLDDVCMAIAREGEIRPAAAVGDGTAGGWFHHTGRFRVAEPVASPTADAVITLVAGLGSRKLLLDCSLRNFSEGALPDGSFSLNSANARFFSGDLAMTMKSLFLLLDAGQDRVIGSPLFLKLVLDDSAAPGLVRL
jgi:hypothetical protein